MRFHPVVCICTCSRKVSPAVLAELSTQWGLCWAKTRMCFLHEWDNSCSWAHLSTLPSQQIHLVMSGVCRKWTLKALKQHYLYLVIHYSSGLSTAWQQISEHKLVRVIWISLSRKCFPTETLALFHQCLWDRVFPFDVFCKCANCWSVQSKQPPGFKKQT